MCSRVFYVMEYDWQKFDLPPFVIGTFNHADFEWDFNDPRSIEDIRIDRSYEFHITDPNIKSLNLDFYDPRSPIVSAAFLSVCDESGVQYRSVPLKVSFSGTPGSTAEFFLFLPFQSTSLLNRELSEYQEDRVVETGEVMMDKSFPGQPVYSWIRRFVTEPVSLNLFHCIELMQLVVSERFVSISRSRGIKGVGFVPIDAGYRYDPWGEIPA